MPVIDVIFHRLAAKEYRGARSRYGRAGPQLADRFRAEVNRAIDRIVAGPEQWPIFRERYRWVRTRRFSYVLYYHILCETQIIIMAVAHSRRRLGYWLRRSPLG